MKKLLIGVLATVGFALGQTPEPSNEQGRALLERARQAVGGTDKLAAILDLRQTTEFSQGELVIEYLAPDHFRMGSPTPSGPLIVYFNDVGGWVASSGSVREVAAPSGKATALRMLPALLLPALDGWRSLKAVDASTVEVRSGGAFIRFAFDAVTGLPARMMYTEYGTGTITGPAPIRFSVAEIYSDWREVDGVKLPFKIVIMQDSQKLSEGTVTDYKINSGLTAQELEKRP